MIRITFPTDRTCLRGMLLIAACLSLASCGAVRNTAGAIGLGQGAVNRVQTEVDGIRFRGRTRSDRENRRDFVATATPFAVNPEAAVDVAVYQATRYCILTFGGSDMDWRVGPDTPLEQLRVEDDTVALEGRCTQR